MWLSGARSKDQQIIRSSAASVYHDPALAFPRDSRCV
jgi:hypothetical protein